MSGPTRRDLALGGVGAVMAMALPRWAGAQERPIGTFPVFFTVAEAAGAPVVDEPWVTAQLARAELLFAPHGVRFQRSGRAALPDGHASLVTRADRDRLAAFLRPSCINVLVVASLKDVDEADRYRFGVHWRPAATPGRRFIILAASAPITVLAHELGHYFGNPHSTTKNNVMSYDRDGDEVFFDAAQVQRIRATARAILRAREVLDATPP